MDYYINDELKKTIQDLNDENYFAQYIQNKNNFIIIIFKCPYNLETFESVVHNCFTGKTIRIEFKTSFDLSKEIFLNSYFDFLKYNFTEYFKNKIEQ